MHEAAHSRNRKSRKQAKKATLATLDQSSKEDAAASEDTCNAASSPLGLFPPTAPSTITNAAGQSLDKGRTNQVASSHHDDTSIDNEALETLETWDVTTISPGAFPVDGPNRSANLETIDPNHSMDETEDVDDLSQIIIAAKVVPDADEMEAEIKTRLTKEIKEEVTMRLMIEGRPPVIAEAVKASPNQKVKWRKWGCVLLVAIFIIVGTVIAVVVTRKQDGNNDTSSQVKDASPQDENKSSSESKDTSPSADACLGATPIQQNQMTISSWIDPTTRPDGLVYSSACADELVSGPMTWFSLVGTGDAYVVSTCSRDLHFDSAISVATGSCDNLQCIGFADFTQGECTESSYGAATVLFRTDVGIPYYIGVEGINSPSLWNFTLSITTVVNAPVNSDCSNSIVIKPGESLVRGTITNATENRHFNTSCAMTAGLPIVWYSLIGTGDVFEVSTCTSDLNFDSGISVSAGSCEDLECIVDTTYDPYVCLETEYSSARVSFLAEVGVEYFLQVHSTGSTWNGDFDLVVSSGQPPANDNCSTATIVEAGTSSVMGSISYSTWDTNMNILCSFGSWDTKIVWYSLIGTGDLYAISTCSSVLTFDSTISILTGACDSLECLIPGLDIQRDCPEAPYRAARVLLPTEIGVEYLIAVEATNYTWQGDFALDISTVEPLPNDECAGAIEIQTNTGPVYGTTMDATPSIFVSSDPFFYPSPDVWYRMVGSGLKTVASVCGDGTTYDAVVEIFEGNAEYCNQTLIATTNDDGSCTLQWFAIDEVIYYLRVSGWCGDGDQFELSVTLM